MSGEPLHAIGINRDKCIGCVHCMKACPTRAIRVRDDKAQLIDDLCIDCGECLRYCPYDAIESHTTSFADRDAYAYKTVLPATALYGQFGDDVNPNDILASLRRSGFDQVFELSSICELHTIATEEILSERSRRRPLISSFCPVVVRLIQHHFPSLCDLILPIEPPREITAKILRETLPDVLNIQAKDIGIFHITPCPAKIVSINHPASMAKSYLDGAISIRDIFPAVLQELHKGNHTTIVNQMFPESSFSSLGIGWTLSGGEARGLVNRRTVSVSGVLDTMRVLDQAEAGQLKDVDFLECMVCPDGCVGGPLAVENRFIAKSRLLRLANLAGEKRVTEKAGLGTWKDKNYFSFQHPVRPLQHPLLDSDPARAIKKAARRDEIIKSLPHKDCGACGSPDCRTFAEDIVRGQTHVDACPFMRKG